MAIDLTPEQRQTGVDNYVRTSQGLTRRGFMKSMAAAAGGAVVASSAAVYFGYEALHGNPVKAALIGAGDEGGVLVGEHNPEFLEFIAVCDIRPSNTKRIFDGEPTGLRKGFKKIYGDNAAKSIRTYSIKEDKDRNIRVGDYMQMLKDDTHNQIEAVVIAAPLCWHAKMACDVMKYGKERGRPIHVLCEKLMGWNVLQCKQMVQTAEETGSILSIGHQRHYSLLYAHAVEILKADILGDIKYISALWHRNNAWPFKPSDEQLRNMVREVPQPTYRDGWFNPVLHEDYDALKASVAQYGFDNVEQLIRWRCHNATGGGLMAELGSHQLDACSIFLGHVHPLSVTGLGGKHFYGRPPASGEANDYGYKTNYNDRDTEDQVFLTYEFPGKNHPKGPNHGTDEDDVVVVTYTSVNTNQFENYGECVKGTRGTMIVEKEASVMLYPETNPNAPGAGPARATTATVETKGSGKTVLEASSTWGAAVAPVGGPGAGPTGGSPGGVVSRGYKEEMEDFAFCVRHWDSKVGYAKNDKGEYLQRLPKCHGEVAMVDAIIALTANRAMRGPELTESEKKEKKRRKPERVEFKPEWFDPKNLAALPDADTVPKIAVS